MNLTLHLTENCNMDCAYCTREKHSEHMSEEVLLAACELAFSSGKTAGLCFFGGEPLLEEELIYRALDRCAELSEEKGMPVQYMMTTNGTLLTERFLERAKAVNMGIGLSFEGKAQDTCRRFVGGQGSFSVVEEKAKLLLRYLPGTHAMMTIAPAAVPQYAESLRYLTELGFRRITGTIAYGHRVHWTDEDLELLCEQLEQISAYYAERFLAGRPFYFSPFDAKIRELLAGENPADRCHLGLRQMPVTPKGELYACTQFIGDEDFKLGDVFNGIDKQKRIHVSKREAAPSQCDLCDLRNRCTHSCGCLNRLETGDENQVSPLQCTYERMLIAIADATADAIYEKAPEAFQKHFAPKNEH